MAVKEICSVIVVLVGVIGLGFVEARGRWGPGGFDWGSSAPPNVNERPPASAYARLQDHRIKGHSMGKTHHRSPLQCANFCDTLPRCLGFNYNLQKKRCSIKKWNQFNGGGALRSKNNVDLYSKLNVPLNCPNGSISDHLRPRCYKIMDQEKTYKESRKQCKSLGGDLLLLPDEGTRWHVMELIGQSLVDETYWIGIKSKKNWIKWDLHGKRHRLLPNLGPHYDNLVSSRSKRCGYLDWDYNGYMYTAACDRVKRSICEFRVPTDTTVNELCPSDTIGFNGRCYWGVDTPQNYQDAEDACVERGGNLVSIDSETEGLFIAQSVWDGLIAQNANPWAGAIYSQANSQWEWEDGNEVDSEVWHNGNTPGTGNGRCSMGVWKQNAIRLRPVQCGSAAKPSICVGDAGEITTDQCANHQCPQNSECEEGTIKPSCQCLPGFNPRRKKKELQCQAANICQSHGDPHFTTYDGAYFNYQGVCRHTLTGVCPGSAPAGLPAWDVKINTIHRSGKSKNVSYTEYAELSVYGFTVTLGLNQEVLVNGEVRVPEFSLNEGQITVAIVSNKDILLTTDFGLSVRYRDYKVDVHAPFEYQGTLCGICGDFDGDKSNDQKTNMVQYQEQSSQGLPQCEPPEDDDVIGTCDPALKSYAEEKCGMINTMTILNACRDSNEVELSTFYDDCLEDACAGDLNDVDDVLCVTMEAIVAVCLAAGFEISNIYRIETECNMNCAEGSFYNSHMSLDVATCQNPEGFYDVSNGVGEGCECIPDYILDDGQCVPVEDCGCVLEDEDDIYILQGSTYVNTECDKSYLCKPGGEADVTDLGGCTDNASCVPDNNGVLTCACDDGFTGNGYNNCEEDEDTSVTGDPHFLVKSRTSGAHLCYDVHGRQDQTMELIQDDDLRLEVNGMLFETNQSTKANPISFFSKISVLYDGQEVIASVKGVYINDELLYKWEEGLSSKRYTLTEHLYLRSGGPNSVEVVSDGFTLHITRTKNMEVGYYMGVFVTNSSGFTRQTKGIIGRFIKSSFYSFDEHATQGFLQMPDDNVVLPVKRVQRFSHAHGRMIDCWLYRVMQKNDALFGDISKYMLPSLNFTPF